MAMALKERKKGTRIGFRTVVLGLLLLAIIAYAMVVIVGKLPDRRSTLADRRTLLAVVATYYKQTGDVPNDVGDLMDQYQRFDYDLPYYEIEDLDIQLIDDGRNIRIKYVMNERSFSVTIPARN